jgi:CheY-like chemotaxis protein
MVSVLIVEDDVRLSRMLTDIVKAGGHAILAAAATVAGALEVLNAGRPDVAVLDLRLKGDELSYPVARELRRLGVPFVFITGFEQQEIDPDFAPNIVLRKPVRASDLLLVLGSLTHRPEGVSAVSASG